MTSTWDPVFAVQSRADVAQGLMDQPSCTSNHVTPMLADRGRAGRGGGRRGRTEEEEEKSRGHRPGLIVSAESYEPVC